MDGKILANLPFSLLRAFLDISLGCMPNVAMVCAYPVGTSYITQVPAMQASTS